MPFLQNLQCQAKGRKAKEAEADLLKPVCKGQAGLLGGLGNISAPQFPGRAPLGGKLFTELGGETSGFFLGTQTLD